MRIYFKEKEKEEGGEKAGDEQTVEINPMEPAKDAEKEKNAEEDRFELDADEDITESREDKSDDLADITEEVGDVDLSNEEPRPTDGKAEPEITDNVLDEEVINSNLSRDEETFAEAQTEEKAEKTQESNEDE